MDFGWDPEDFQPEDPSDAVTLARHATVTADCAADVGCSWSISSLVGMCNLCLSIYIYILIYHSFGCSQLIEVKQNYLETNTTIPKCWWYYIYIYALMYTGICACMQVMYYVIHIWYCMSISTVIEGSCVVYWSCQLHSCSLYWVLYLVHRHSWYVEDF